ncbi:MAG: preprotein translocase subunit SecE [Lachnospiraceae bacterium]|nr:preprotein translocase subunit SecE [Lachnospiraceae bacterium]MCR5477562.1 preprotein translocase subunit SecE [Lachnospiraceae bacterium]
MADTEKKEPKTPFFDGVKAEFKKINWPDRQTTLKQSVAVVAISVAMGLVIAIIDFAVQYGVNWLTSL